jgi:hypothetical protein
MRIRSIRWILISIPGLAAALVWGVLELVAIQRSRLGQRLRPS